MSSAPEPRDLLVSADPAREFWAAHESGQRIALRTSGTTAAPRVVVRTTASWIDSFEAVTQLTRMTDTSMVWIPGPPAATMNLFARVHASFAGATLAAEAQQATHAVLTPLGLRRALADDGWGDGVTTVVAGDALPPSLVTQARERGVLLHHYYGASELSFVAWGSGGQGLMPFPGVECRVDEDGVIWARSGYLSDGYLGGRSGPLRRHEDGFATVGDRGSLVDGALVVHGRGEEGITTAGVTVVVADVEAVLRRVARGAVLVVGLPDPRLGEVVTAVVTEPSDLEPVQVAASALTPAQRPRRWEVVREIPVTGSGKPDRARLVEMLAAGETHRVGR
jgi:long-chain acyl-CoA synthetase